MSPIDTQQESTPKAGELDTDKDYGELTVYGSAQKPAASINKSLQNSSEVVHGAEGKEIEPTKDGRNARNIQRQAIAMKMTNM